MGFAGRAEEFNFRRSDAVQGVDLRAPRFCKPRLCVTLPRKRYTETRFVAQYRRMIISVQTLFVLAAALMLIDALGYSLGAVGPIQRAVTTGDPYWKRRLRLNLLLANQGMYFAGVVALLGSYFVHTQREAARAIEILCLLTCLYTVLTVPLFRPRDWPHGLPRVTAAVLILMGLAKL